MSRAAGRGALRHDGRVHPRQSRTAAAAAAVVLLAGCSALSGKNSSDTSFSARPPQPSSSAPSVHAAFSKASTVKAVLADAKKDLAAVFNLDYRHLTSNRSDALAASTGKYEDTLRTLLSDNYRSALRKQKQLQQPVVSTVALAGLKDHDSRASVFAAVTVTTQSKTVTTPASHAVQGAVTLKLVHGRWRIAKIDQKALPTGTVPANHDLAAAEKAVRASVPKLYHLSRKTFDKDFTASLDVQTGDLLTRSQNQRTGAKAVLDNGKYDLSATVAGLSVISADGTSAEFVVNIKQYHRLSSKTRLGPYPLDLDVTAEYVDRRWRLSSSDPVQ